MHGGLINNKKQLMNLNNYLLNYRHQLSITKNITFGTEIEVEGINPGECKCELKKNLTDFAKWDVSKDLAINGFVTEVRSSILSNTAKSWQSLYNVLSLLKQIGATETNECGGHIHFGSQILANNIIPYKRLLSLWALYEPIIYRFSYGEHLKGREPIDIFAYPLSNLILENQEQLKNFNKLDYLIEYICKDMCQKYERNVGLNFNSWDGPNLFVNNTIEIRCPNGSVNPIIWQNNINFFAHLLMACNKNDFPDEFINQKLQTCYSRYNGDIDNYNKIYLEDAIELANIIFNLPLDKINFLCQYLKNGQEIEKDDIILNDEDFNYSRVRLTTFK